MEAELSKRNVHKLKSLTCTENENLDILLQECQKWPAAARKTVRNLKEIHCDETCMYILFTFPPKNRCLILLHVTFWVVFKRNAFEKKALLQV